MPRQACGVYHHQQFHKVVRFRESGLDDEYRTTANRLVVTRLELSVAEFQTFAFAESSAVGGYDFFGEIAGVASREKLDFVDSHNIWIMSFIRAAKITIMFLKRFG